MRPMISSFLKTKDPLHRSRKLINSYEEMHGIIDKKYPDQISLIVFLHSIFLVVSSPLLTVRLVINTIVGLKAVLCSRYTYEPSRARRWLSQKRTVPLPFLFVALETDRSENFLKIIGNY